MSNRTSTPRLVHRPIHGTGPSIRDAIAIACLVGFALVCYGPGLSIPFIGDDYVFLDKTRAANFADLWSFGNTNFGWYRPWSRELHFWFLQRTIGLNETGFRLASLLLWAGALAGYWRFLSGFAGRSVAWVATLGAASMGLWGAPLVWISGSQDLWMSALGMWALVYITSGRVVPGVLLYAAALLSKETAAVLPAVALFQLMLISRLSLFAACRRIAPLVIVTAGWLWLHPLLIPRLLGGGRAPVLMEEHPAFWEILGRSALAVVNLESVLRPIDPAALSPGIIVGSCLLLAAAALALRIGAARPVDAPGEAPGTRRLVTFGASWALVGWLPLLHPSVGFHAYYGCVGALGAWVAIASIRPLHSRWLTPMLVALGLLRGVGAAAMSWDWGSEWYQRRAGNMLELIETQLKQAYPRLPSGTRVYFGNIPNNIGLVAGESPAIRVWYADSTLQAGFYSYYRPRTAHSRAGRDLFFHFDTLTGLREVRTEAEDLRLAYANNPDWERDHEALAMSLLRAGDMGMAAMQFEKIALLPHRPDALAFAAAARLEEGDSIRAGQLMAEAVRRMDGTPADIGAWVARLRASMPRN